MKRTEVKTIVIDQSENEATNNGCFPCTSGSSSRVKNFKAKEAKTSNIVLPKYKEDKRPVRVNKEAFGVQLIQKPKRITQLFSHSNNLHSFTSTRVSHSDAVVVPPAVMPTPLMPTAVPKPPLKLNNLLATTSTAADTSERNTNTKVSVIEASTVYRDGLKTLMLPLPQETLSSEEKLFSRHRQPLFPNSNNNASSLNQNPSNDDKPSKLSLPPLRLLRAGRNTSLFAPPSLSRVPESPISKRKIHYSPAASRRSVSIRSLTPISATPMPTPIFVSNGSPAETPTANTPRDSNISARNSLSLNLHSTKAPNSSPRMYNLQSPIQSTTIKLNNEKDNKTIVSASFDR